MHHHGTIEFLGQCGFLIAAEIVAPVDCDAFLFQSIDRFVIADPWIWSLSRRFELGRVALECFQFSAPTFEHATYYVRYELFGKFHIAVQVAVRDFRLDHPEFRQMTPRFGFLGAKGRPEAIALAECERARLRIELSALRQV